MSTDTCYTQHCGDQDAHDAHTKRDYDGCLYACPGLTTDCSLDDEADPEGDPIELEAFASLLGDLQEHLREGAEIEGAMQRSAECRVPISAGLQDWANEVVGRVEDSLRRYRGEA